MEIVLFPNVKIKGESKVQFDVLCAKLQRPRGEVLEMIIDLATTKQEELKND